MATTQLKIFNSINIDDFEMQHVKSRSTELKTSTFVELSKFLKGKMLLNTFYDI